MAREDRTRGVLDAFNAGDFIGVHFSAAEFDALIVQHGSSGELRRAMTCPCVRLDTRTPDAACRSCHGIGRLYPEHMREPMMYLDTQRQTTAKLAAAGKMAHGTIQIIMPSGVVPGLGDMLLPEDEEHVVQEVLFRDGANRVTDADLRPYRIAPDQVKPALVKRHERLLYPVQCCIEAAAYEDADGDVVYANDSEYEIDNDGRWTWRGDHGPASGRAWSVRYRAPAVYVIYTASPAFRSEADERMPHRVTAQRLDKVAAEDLRQ